MLEAELEQFERNGFAILEDVLDASALSRLAAALAPFEVNRPTLRTVIGGQLGQCVHSLAGKGEPFLQLAEHPRVMEVVDRVLMPSFLLSTLHAIRLHADEHAQPWHTDDAFYFMPRPHRLSLSVGVLWAIDELDDDEGAPELIAGSHRWGGESPDAHAHEVTAVTMPAGSALVFDGSLWHRGGALRAGTRLAISAQYCQPWLRPLESQLLVVPPESALACSPRMKSLLGYSVHTPCVGLVDGMHPLRLVEPAAGPSRDEGGPPAQRRVARPAANLAES